MTEVQSLLLAPFTKVRKKPHFLWYAHAHPSKFLLAAFFLVDGVVTSTSGSCPVRGKKVFKIGQAIDSGNFYRPNLKLDPLNKFCHVGRFDESKGIMQIISAVSVVRKSKNDVKLTLVGSPSNQLQQKYATRIKLESEKKNYSTWVTFTGAMKREEIPSFLESQDVFVHAYKGSLDKTLIEATLLGLPVVTVNEEYLDIFGSWAKNYPSNIELGSELDYLIDLDSASRRTEIIRRQTIALSEHSLSSWSRKLSQLLHNSIKI
jgi:glycosyltransferase involved in cell wall biosynthesis